VKPTGDSEQFLPGVPAVHVLERLSKAGGNEVASGKFASLESSAALAVNTFGWFVDRPELLPAFPPLCGNIPGCQRRGRRARAPSQGGGLHVTMLSRELAGLFVDDGAFALAIIAVVVVAAIVAMLIPEVPLAAGAILLFGCLAALLVSVARAGRS
jgi:hypothetical protein